MGLNYNLKTYVRSTDENLIYFEQGTNQTWTHRVCGGKQGVSWQLGYGQSLEPFNHFSYFPKVEFGR